MDPKEFEIAYQEYVSDLKRFIPDGILEVGPLLLQELGLDTFSLEEEGSFSQQFYVLESPDKLTLFNEKYVIWIVPKLVDNQPTTYSFIARNLSAQPHLEMVFSTTGPYNHSQLVLQLLDRFLQDIEENDRTICRLRP